MSTELAVVYAALILMDDNVEITADRLQTLVSAAGVEVEPIWFSLYAKALAGQDLNTLLFKAATLSDGTSVKASTENNEVADSSPVENKHESDDGSEEEFTLDIFGDF